MGGFGMFKNKGGREKHENATAPTEEGAPAVEDQNLHHHGHHDGEVDDVFDGHGDDGFDHGSFDGGAGFDLEEDASGRYDDEGFGEPVHDYPSTSTMGAFSHSIGREEPAKTQDSESSDMTTQACNKKLGLFGRLRNKKAMAEDGTTGEMKQTRPDDNIDATSSKKMRISRASPTGENEDGPSWSSGHDGSNAGISAGGSRGGGNECAGISKKDDAKSDAEDISTERETGERLDFESVGQFESERRFSNIAGSSNIAEESKKCDDALATAAQASSKAQPSTTMDPDIMPQDNSLKTTAERKEKAGTVAAATTPTGGLATQGRTFDTPKDPCTLPSGIGSSPTFGSAGSENDRILPGPFHPDAEQRITAPAVEGGSMQNTKGAPPLATSPSVFRKSSVREQQLSPMNTKKSISKTGAYPPFGSRLMGALPARTSNGFASTRLSKSISQNPRQQKQMFQSSSSGHNSSSLHSNNPRFHGLARSGTFNNTSKTPSLLHPSRGSNMMTGSFPSASLASSTGKSTSFSQVNNSEFTHTGMGQTSSSTTSSSPSKLRGTGNSTLNPTQITCAQQLTTKVSANAKISATRPDSRMAPAPTLSPTPPNTQEFQRLAASATQSVASVGNPKSAVQLGQQTPMNKEKAGSILQTPKQRDSDPDHTLGPTRQDVAAATITPGPRTALKNKVHPAAARATDETQEFAPIATNQVVSNEKNTDKSIHNERIIPAGNANNEQKFEENHEEFQRIIRDLTDIHESSDKAILDLKVRLATAHARAVLDQGDLCIFLGSLVQLGARMDAMIGGYEEFVEQRDLE